MYRETGAVARAVLAADVAAFEQHLRGDDYPRALDCLRAARARSPRPSADAVRAAPLAEPRAPGQ